MGKVDDMRAAASIFGVLGPVLVCVFAMMLPAGRTLKEQATRAEIKKFSALSSALISNQRTTTFLAKAVSAA